MSNRFFIGLLIAIVLFVGGFAVFKQDKKDGASSGVQPTNHVKGAGTSGVTLIEYGDFECSACFEYEPIVKKVIEKYGDQITFQFRSFPITSKHPNSFAAHRAAEAAAKQGKFWEMHDILYARAYQQTAQGPAPIEWVATSNPSTFFESYAREIGLNLEQFKSDAASSEVNDFINADIAASKDVPVSGTPTFLINGKKIETPTSLEDFYKLIDEAIAEKANS